METDTEVQRVLSSCITANELHQCFVAADVTDCCNCPLLEITVMFLGHLRSPSLPLLCLYRRGSRWWVHTAPPAFLHPLVSWLRTGSDMGYSRDGGQSFLLANLRLPWQCTQEVVARQLLKGSACRAAVSRNMPALVLPLMLVCFSV